MQKYFTIVTDLGTELIAKAAQRGEKVNIVNIAAGDGNGSEYKPTSDMTALKREIWRGAIQNYEIDSVAKNVIKISGTIPKDVGRFVLREIALFDDQNNMIAICNAPDLLKAVLEEGALTEAVVYMRIALTNTEAVNIVVDSSAVYATARDLDAHKNDETAHQKLFDEKANKTETENALKQKLDKQDFEAHKNDETAHQKLFDEKVDKTDFETSLNEVENTLQQKANKNDVDKALETKANKNDVEASLATKVNTTVLTTELNKKVDKTDFTGTNIGSLLEAAGWQSGGDMTAEEILTKLIDKFNWKNNSIAIGSYAFQSCTTGSNNVAFGTLALNYNTTGSRNVAVGTGALNRNEIGEGNTAIGTNSAHNTKGSENTALGVGANVGENYNCCTALGHSAEVTGSNQVQLGASTDTVYAQTAVQTRSDARDKIEIQDTVLGLDFIKKLVPRQFRMNSRELYFEQGQKRDFTAQNDGSKAGKRFHQGFVAQEVKQVLDDMGIDFAGYQDHKINGGEDVLSLGYTEFIAPIVKAIQQQQQMIELQQKEIAELKQKINGEVS